MAGPTFSVNISVEESGKKRPEYTLNSDLSGEITLQDLLNFTKDSLIITADQFLKEEQSAGFDKNPVALVDGRRTKNIGSVNPLGQVEFVARQEFGQIILDAYQGLLDRSKVLTGTYKASHYVFHNGKQVAIDLAGIKSWLATSPEFKNGDTVRIVNIQPYARRLERLGVTAQRSKPRQEKSGPRQKGQSVVFAAPNGAYQLTARSIRSKYKQNALIKFSFLPGSSIGLSGTFKNGRRGRNSKGRPYLYPTLIFTVQEQGIL